MNTTTERLQKPLVSDLTRGITHSNRTGGSTSKIEKSKNSKLKKVKAKVFEQRPEQMYKSSLGFREENNSLISSSKKNGILPVKSLK